MFMTKVSRVYVVIFISLWSAEQLCEFLTAYVKYKGEERP
jgi:hypothetical protein